MRSKPSWSAPGHSSYRARNVAARNSRDAKRHTPMTDLLSRWEAEAEAVGWSVDAMARAVEHHALSRPQPAPRLDAAAVRSVVNEALAPEGPLAKRKVFSRRDVVVAVAPAFYGAEPAELSKVVDRTVADPEAVPLLGVAGASERAYATAATIAREHAIAASVEAQATRRDAPAVTPEAAVAAVAGA